jgi:hypothetical protein
MTFWRDWVSWLLIAVAAGCFVAGGLPQWSEGVDPATGDKLNELRVGFWFSPAYEHVRREYDHSPAQNDERGPGKSRTFGWETQSGINWVSWSSLALVIGLGSLVSLNWRRQALAGHQGQKAEVQSKH